jgi:MFS family permease
VADFDFSSLVWRLKQLTVANLSAKSIIKHPPHIFYGWWIVLVSLLADGLKHGTFNRGFTVYVIPIQTELGISTAAIGWADTLGRLMGGVQGPLMGYLTDRLGPRVMLTFGGLASGLGFILLSFTGNYAFFLLIFVGFLSVGFRSGYNNASVAAVNNWFRRKRGLAMSIVSMGNGLGGALAPLVGLLVFTVGWRTSVLISGIAIIAVVVPLSLLVKRSPESMGLLPDGDLPDPASVQSENGQLPRSVGTSAAHTIPARHRSSGPARELDFTAKEAMRTPSYWLLVLATALRNTVHSGMSFLLAPVMVWFLRGAGRGQEESLPIAAAFVGAVAIGTIVFNPFVGWLGDKFPRKKLSAICMISGAASLALLLDRSGNLWQLAIFSMMLAFAESANPLNWAIMGDFFGRRAFATLRGWQHLPDQLLSMWTAVWMGLIFDQTGSFYWALLPLASIYGLAAIGYWIIPRPKIPPRLRAREEAGAVNPA